MKQTFGKIKEAISNAKHIAIFCHIDPDVDCLSSMIGLGIALKKMGKQVTMFTHEPFSDYQKAILDENLVQIGGFEPKKFNLLICVDTPEADRLGIYGDAFVAHANTVKIDHHPAVEKLAKIEFIDSSFSSCAEIISKFLQFMGVKFTEEIATILFAGLSADTNSFTNTNVSLQSFEDANFLVEAGANIIKVNNANTRMQPLVKLKLNKVFYRNFQIYGKQIAISSISHRELLAANAQKRDAAGLSNQLLNYEGINIACMIVEREPHKFDLSFRSMAGFDVSQIASRLNGGGHKEAAGGMFVAENCKEAKKVVLAEIKKYLKERATNERK